jgi:hypothetical protein
LISDNTSCIDRIVLSNPDVADLSMEIKGSPDATGRQASQVGFHRSRCILVDRGFFTVTAAATEYA